MKVSPAPASGGVDAVALREICEDMLDMHHGRQAPGEVDAPSFGRGAAAGWDAAVSAFYKAAVDRVNRATDAEMGGVHRSFAPAPAPASGDQSLGAMLNHAALTIRGLEERIALYRANYTTNSALDHGRRQIIDDFEKFLHERAALSQYTSDGRVGE